MLRLRELLPSIKLANGVGQRKFGHFDHDATCATGPVLEPASTKAAAKKASRKSGARVVVFEKARRAKAGDPAYRVVAKKK